MKPLFFVVLLGFLAAVYATQESPVRWCVTSEKESQKCNDLVIVNPGFSCVSRNSIKNCLIAIQSGEADAITLDGGHIFTAGLSNYDLHPIIAEKYNASSDNCYYAVAVAKAGTKFGFHELQGKRTCHTGLGKSAGWNVPIGTLVSRDIIKWNGTDDQELQEAVSEYFGGSCVPGAPVDSKLCSLCKNSCVMTNQSPYYGYAGAFKCLKDDLGEVAFVKHVTVPDSEKSNYELLCPDNKRMAVDDYAKCHLARVPAHAVVSRKDNELADKIWKRLESVKDHPTFNLFSSENYQSKNLMFKDSTKLLVRLPPDTDSSVYLGTRYMNVLRSINKMNLPTTTVSAFRWCVVGPAEKDKCDAWDLREQRLKCVVAKSAEECLRMIMKKEAEVVTVDGGQVYTAGKCGLVPAMVEQYDADQCGNPQATGSHYYAVAVVKKGSGVTWSNLKNRKSCHTGVGRNAGWNIPMGHIYKETKSCNFGSYFSASCAPGANATSTLCSLCIGNSDGLHKCEAGDNERYNGYAGAFRCLVEGGGDVAFIKHTIIEENSNGNGPDWAQPLKSTNYELISPEAGPVPVNQYESCHLAKVTAHAVVTRPEIHADVVSFLKSQETRFGRSGTDDFRMFVSEEGKNLLFKDSTKCLQEVPLGTSEEEFLGREYITAMDSLRKCSAFTSELEKFCSHHFCQQ